MKQKISSLKRQASPLLEDQLTQKLQQGLMHHQNGLIQKAKIIYEEILNRQPLHFHAIHLLGFECFPKLDFCPPFCHIP